MADFKVKNGLQAKRYLQSTTALASTATAIDLSKGNNFSITPSGNPTFTFTNPPATGKAQAFSVEVTGGNNGMDEIFSTTTYTGTSSSSLTINNGLNLSGDGGLVWTKERSSGGGGHILFSTDASGNHSGLLVSSSTAAAGTGYQPTYFTFNNNGYTTTNTVGDSKVNGNDYVSWSWKKTANFFDVVSYTGNGTNNRAISHSLGEEPGMIICKRTSSNGNWGVYHRGRGNSLGLRLDSTGVAGAMSINNETINSSSFGVSTGGYALDNNNGDDYIAYLFGHNSSTVHCGTYTGDGSDTNREINVGFKPQWLMVKNTTTAYNWIIIDSVRGEGQTPPTSNVLFANVSNAEDPAGDRLFFSDNGFTLSTSSFDYNKSGDTFVYVAIAAGGAGSLTWPTSVKYPSGTAPSSPALGKKDVFTFMTVDGGTSYVGKKAVEGLS